jgi:formylmethanofuran dehydrogenase subunit E-like metal-binding protein
MKLNRKIIFINKMSCLALVVIFIIFGAWSFCFGSDRNANYKLWESVGKAAAETSFSLMEKVKISPPKGNCVVMTNAGYAEVNGALTQGALDGAAVAVGASRGKNTLVEIQSAPWDSLWFAFYDKGSSYCTYLEIDPSKISETISNSKNASKELFTVTAIERIDAGYLNEHLAEYDEKFKNKMFGNNAFRIITIANAIAVGAPSNAVRAFEFHDHYCPGVSSGILMASYLKKYFPAIGRGYFVYSIDPWCKEDALLVLLNATPGKKSYAVYYPNENDKAEKPPEIKNVSTIVFRNNDQTKKWEGIALGFEWIETGCPKTGNALVDKLCSDLWFLEHMDTPEVLVKEIKRFELAEGVSPKDLARPGIDPLKVIGWKK